MVCDPEATVVYAFSYNSALKTRSVVSMVRLLSMRYERAACTEYSRSARLQPHTIVTMQLRGKRAERNIRVKCSGKVASRVASYPVFLRAWVPVSRARPCALPRVV